MPPNAFTYSEYWNIPRIWNGDVFIYGGGTSMKDFDNTLLYDKRVVGCNDAYLLGEKVCDFTCFGDGPWYDAHLSDLHKYKGTVVTNNNKGFVNPKSSVKICKRTKKEISTDDWCLSWFNNTGATAIELAVKLGGRRIYLLGFDCKLNGEKTESNWYKARVKEQKPTIKATIYSKFMEGFKRFYHEIGVVFPYVEIYNLNMDSALTVFPKKEMEDVFGTD